ncbi:MAG: ABC transporter permease, partial [Oscillospiraceae bacterium]|nr:ABC transporter permease [Oscillospiraceae bacterium]
MKNRNFKNVFLFTLSTHLRSKSYKGISIVLALLLLIGIPAVMCLVAAFGGSKAEEVHPSPELVAVVDLAEGEKTDLGIFAMAGDENSSAEYIAADTLETANELCRDKKAFILVLEGEGGVCNMNVVMPENALLNEDAAEAYTTWLSQFTQIVAMMKAGLTEEEAAEVMMQLYMPDEPIEEDITEETDPTAAVREALSFAVPYITVMLLYFLILFYGQGTSQKVMEEKVSKLMDTFLVSVSAQDMVFGK